MHARTRPKSPTAAGIYARQCLDCRLQQLTAAYQLAQRGARAANVPGMHACLKATVLRQLALT